MMSSMFSTGLRCVGDGGDLILFCVREGKKAVKTHIQTTMLSDTAQHDGSKMCVDSRLSRFSALFTMNSLLSCTSKSRMNLCSFHQSKYTFFDQSCGLLHSSVVGLGTVLARSNESSEGCVYPAM